MIVARQGTPRHTGRVLAAVLALGLAAASGCGSSDQPLETAGQAAPAPQRDFPTPEPLATTPATTAATGAAATPATTAAGLPVPTIGTGSGPVPQPPTTTGAAGSGAEDATPAASGCDAGLIVLEDYITDTDAGCRPERCDLGRNPLGSCLRIDVVMPPPTTAANQPPGGDPCEQPAPGDPLMFSSHDLDPGEQPIVLLALGVWRMDVCIRGNDRATGAPERLAVTLFTPLGEDRRMQGGTFLDVRGVANGVWSNEDLYLGFPDGPLPLRVGVKAVGGGDWVVTFTPVDLLDTPDN